MFSVLKKRSSITFFFDCVVSRVIWQVAAHFFSKTLGTSYESTCFWLANTKQIWWLILKALRKWSLLFKDQVQVVIDTFHRHVSGLLQEPVKLSWKWTRCWPSPTLPALHRQPLRWASSLLMLYPVDALRFAFPGADTSSAAFGLQATRTSIRTPHQAEASGGARPF